MKAFSTSGTARSRYVSSKGPVKNDKGGGSQGICICPHPSTMLLLLSHDDEEAFNKYRTKSLASSFRRFPSSSTSAEITVAANDDARNGDALLIASRRFLPPVFQLSRGTQRAEALFVLLDVVAAPQTTTAPEESSLETSCISATILLSNRRRK